MEYRFRRKTSRLYFGLILAASALFSLHTLNIFIFFDYFCSFLFLLRVCVQLGMNTKDYKYKWGGEDWDLLDRVLMASLEVERNKYPGLYHHYHPKQKEWN